MVVLAAASVVLISCRSPAPSAIPKRAEDLLTLLLPAKIHVVKQFTSWERSTGDGIDGIILYVQPLNSTDDPVQAAGTMLAELYAFQPASGEPRGNRIEIWDLSLASRKDQQAHWNRATQMYEFHLELSSESREMSPGKQFVLEVTYNAPLGEHRTDSVVLKTPLTRGSLSQG